jgi:hypothetical protein
MGRKRKFEPIEIHATEPADIFQTHRQEISKAIVQGIDYGLKYKKKRVDFAQVIVKNILVITLSIDSREFMDLLNENLQTLIDYEDYETCALVIKLKEKLNETVTKKHREVV